MDKKDNQTIDIAPLRTDEIWWVMDKTKNVLNVKHRFQNIIKENNSGELFSRKEVDTLEKVNVSLNDKIYYMLTPENLKNIMGRTTDRNAVMMNALYHSLSLDVGNFKVPVAAQQMKAYSAMHNFRTALKNGKDFKYAVTMFDIETIGSKNAFGEDTVNGIYDYSFIKFITKNKPKAYSGLIGVQDEESKKVLASISEALKNKTALTGNDEVTYKYIARLGASEQYVRKDEATGRWLSERLTEAPESVYATQENFEKGRKLLEKIGADQGSYEIGGKKLHVGYKNLIDDIIATIDENTIIAGHNIEKFDIPAIRNVLANIPGAKEYLQEKGFDLRKYFGKETGFIYDSWTILHALSADEQMMIRRGIYDKDHPLAKGFSPFQLEALYRALAPEGVDISGVHHNATTDTMQNAKAIGIAAYNNETFVFGRDFYSQVEKLIKEKINRYDDAISKIDFSNNDKPMYVIPKKGAGQNLFGYTTLGNKHFFNNGVVVENGKIVDTAKQFASALFKKDSLYIFNPNTIETINGESEAGRELRGKYFPNEVSGNILKINLEAGDSDKVRINSTTTLFVPEESFSKFFSETFNTIAIGDQIMPGAEKYANSRYFKSGSEMTFLKPSEIQEQASKNSTIKAFENLSRGIQKGSNYSTLRYGLAIQDMYRVIKKTHGEVTLDDLFQAIRDIVVDNNDTKFRAITSGINLTKNLEAEQIFHYGARVFNASFFRDAWGRDDKFLPAWFNSSLTAAIAINPDSQAAQIMRKLGPGKENGALFYSALQKTMATNALNASGSLEKMAHWGYLDDVYAEDSSRFTLKMPAFLKSVMPKGMVRKEFQANSVTLNLDNLYDYKNVINRLGIFPKGHIPRSDEQDGLFSKFVDHMLADNKDIFAPAGLEYGTGEQNDAQKWLKDIREGLLETARDPSLSLDEKSARLIKSLIDARYVHAKYLDQSIGYGDTRKQNIVMSPAFSQAADEKGIKIVDKSIASAQEEIKQLQSPQKEQNAIKEMEDYISGGKKLRMDYFKQLEGLEKEVRKKRMVIFDLQQQGAKVYANRLFEHIERNGGSLTFRRDGHLIASFAGDKGAEFDLTNFIPRLESNGGITSVRVGSTAYVSQLSGWMGSNGNLKVRTIFDNAARKIFSFYDDNPSFVQKRIDEVGKTGEGYVARALMSGLSVGNELFRRPGLPTSAMRDAGLNMMMDVDGILKNMSGRKSLSDYLSRFYDNPNIDEEARKHINNILKFTQEHNDEKKVEYTSSKVENSFRYLMYKEIISPNVYIKDLNGQNVNFQISSLLKDSQENGNKISLLTTEFSNELFDNQARGIQFVRDATIQANKDEAAARSIAIAGRNITKQQIYDSYGTLKAEIPIPQLVTKNNTVFGKKLNGINIAQDFSVTRMEMTSKMRDELIKKLYERGENPAVLQKLNLRMQTFEGGGYLSGKLLRSTGYVPGTRHININYRDIDSQEQKENLEIQIGRDAEGKFRVKYQPGYIVRKGENIIDVHSDYSGIDESFAAKNSSVVKRKYATRTGNILLSEAQVEKAVEEHIQKNNLQPTNEYEYRNILNELFSEQIVAEPVAIPGAVKIITGNQEKHALQHGILSLRDIQDEDIQKILDDKAFAAASEKVGFDVTKAALNEEIFEDIASGNFKHLLFRGASTMELKERIEQYGRDKFKEKLYQGRSLLDDLLKKETGADLFTQEYVALEKHESPSKDLERTYRKLVEKFISENDSAETATRKAAGILENAIGGGLPFIDEEGNLSIRKQENAKHLSINHNILKDIRDKHNIDYYALKEDTTFSLVNDAVNFDKEIKIGSRESNSLFNSVMDPETLQEIRRNMGDDKEFRSIFSEAIDENFNLKKEYAGKPIWQRGMRAVLQSSFAFDKHDQTLEHAIENGELDPELADEYKELRDSLKAAYGERANISYEHTRDAYQYRWGNNAHAMNTGKLDDATVKQFVEQGRFKEIDALDVATDFKNNANYVKYSPNAIWNRNAKVNLLNEELGLDQKFFEERGLQTSLFVPGSTTEVVGNSLALNNYQQKANTIFNQYQKLRDLNKDPVDNQQAIEEVRNSIGKNISDFSNELQKYLNDPKKGTSTYNLLNRRLLGSARGKAQVVDVSSVMDSEIPAAADPYSKMKYKGVSLREHYQKGRYVSFIQASTQDLAKYGFDDKYFEKISGAQASSKKFNNFKKTWLQKAKTEGLQAIVNRAPSDYPFSTRSVQLYFSDDIASGIFQTDSITASLAKLDADGDTNAIAVMKTMNAQGQMIDNLVMNDKELSQLADNKIIDDDSKYFIKFTKNTRDFSREMNR